MLYYTNIYIYIERERDTHYIYIYIYIYHRRRVRPRRRGEGCGEAGTLYGCSIVAGQEHVGTSWMSRETLRPSKNVAT